MLEFTSPQSQTDAQTDCESQTRSQNDGCWSTTTTTTPIQQCSHDLMMVGSGHANTKDVKGSGEAEEKDQQAMWLELMTRLDAGKCNLEAFMGSDGLFPHLQSLDRKWKWFSPTKGFGGATIYTRHLAIKALKDITCRSPGGPVYLEGRDFFVGDQAVRSFVKGQIDAAALRKVHPSSGVSVGAKVRKWFNAREHYYDGTIVSYDG
jgi:hypothetical protein